MGSHDAMGPKEPMGPMGHMGPMGPAGPGRPAAAAHGGRAAAVGGGRPALQLNLVPYVIGTFFQQDETDLFGTSTYIYMDWYCV